MKTPTITASILLMACVATQPAMAQGSAQHFSETIGNSAQAAGHSIAGTAKLASGVIAVPLAVSGAAGHVSSQMASDLWRTANTPIGEPLPISDENITAGPPPATVLTREEEL